MAGRWLLDTSALLALRDNEAGAERVAELLQRSQARQGSCLVCFMSRMELLYRVWKDEGERVARLADAQLRSLPLDWVAAIKATHPLSVADAWIAAAAEQEGAVLVHKDPEFRSLAHLPQDWLGC
jgi:predicted nucleic acid-binding protein